MHKELNALSKTNARFVVWGAKLPVQSYRSIGSDNVLGGTRATAHLARLGRRRIAFVGGTDPEAMQRRRGYQNALKQAGLEFDPLLVCDVDRRLRFVRPSTPSSRPRQFEPSNILSSLGSVWTASRALEMIRSGKRQSVHRLG